MRKHLRGEDGSVLVMKLAFMALTLPLVTAALGLATTLAIDSRVKSDIAKSQYSVLGGNQYALYRLLYEDGYYNSLETGVADSSTITLNGKEVTVTVLRTSDPLVDPPPPSADNSRKLQTSKTVVPTTASPNVPITYRYTVTVTNLDDQPENLRKIHDELPPGFSYLAGTTGGVTDAEPSKLGQRLTWELAGLQINLQPGASVTLTFDAAATLDEGNFCNEAWAEPGDKKTSTGKTARVQVGTPPDEMCDGPAVTVTKAVDPPVAQGDIQTVYTYMLTIENTGTAVLNMGQVRDLLPEGFLYVPASTTGDITTADPTATMLQGRQRLDWDFVPQQQVYPQETRSVSFKAESQLPPGEYWNEAWVTFDEFGYSMYTGPTAVVKVMSVAETVATDASSVASSVIWVGTDTHVITEWNITR